MTPSTSANSTDALPKSEPSGQAVSGGSISLSDSDIEWICPSLNTKPFDPFKAFGMAAWLWTQSSLHTDWTVQLMELTIWPAIRHRQFLLGRDKNGRPVVYVSWAKLDEERERRYLRNPSSLDIHEWNTGDQVWFVDWIAPFGGSRVAARKIQNDIFPNDTGHSLHVKKGRTQARIYDHFGINVTRERKRAAVEALQRNLRTAFSC